MSLEEGFLLDIIEHPADDVPRLVYADWLEEQGDRESLDLASFIRLQITAEAMPVGCQRRVLEERCDELLADHRATWAAGVRDLVWREEFRRGFVEGVTLSSGMLLEHGEQLFALAPIRRLGIRPRVSSPGTPGYEFQLLQIATSSFLSRVIGLRVEMPIRELPYRHLGVLPNLGNLQELEVVTTTGGDYLLDSVQGWQQINQLTRLAVLYQEGPFGVESSRSRYARGGWPGPAREKLREFRMSGWNLSDPFLAALVFMTPMPALRHLDLSNNLIHPRWSFAAVAGSISRQLEVLNLSGNHLVNAAMAGWSEAKMPALRVLDLSENRLGVDAMFALAVAPLPSLEDLDLSGNPLHDDGIEMLVSRIDDRPLRSLGLRGCEVTDDGIEFLLRDPDFASLEYLDLRENRIGQSGKKRLIERFGKALRIEREEADGPSGSGLPSPPT